MPNSRRIGASAEREFAGLIHDHLGVFMVRNLEQSRSGGYDLVVHENETGPAADTLRGCAIEVKRQSTATPALLRGWWAQACVQAEPAGKTPVLAYRKPRHPWQVIVPLSWATDVAAHDYGLDWTCALSIEGFALIVREYN